MPRPRGMMARMPTDAGTQARREAVVGEVATVPFWWHSIDVGHGITTPGRKPPDLLARELAHADLPDLTGRSVLDIGAWDGYFSFAAERRGAARVVALDHYVWSLDIAAQQEYWEECRSRDEVPQMYHEVPGLWKPDELPGKRGFDVAHRLLGSRVEPLVGDFTTMDLEALGTFDVVLFLGVLYHMQEPLSALRRVRVLTADLAVIETEAIAVPGLEELGLAEFYGQAELNHDISNWWAPTVTALGRLCLAAGFSEVTVKCGPPDGATGPTHYRAVVHARA